MFGSTNLFGQTSNNNPFGTQTQSVFGQNNNTSSSSFAPKPFGASTPFGAQTGSSMFGGTSTGVFGTPQASSSPFGASSQAFGSRTPAFGASSAPAFGSSPSPFSATSAFGQNSFCVSTAQSSPFGSTTQQSQPAFGNSTFGSSTPFGASNTSAFRASSTPAFGASNTSAFHASSTPAFGATSSPTFGATNTPAFGASSTPAFGSTNTPAFGASSTPSFGTTNSPGFGASPTQAFGNNAFGSGGSFGAPNTSAFGAPSTSTFGASSTPSFSFGSSPAFGSGSFTSTQSPFGALGAQTSTPTFGGQSTFGGQQGGSRVMPYAPTTEVDLGTSSSQPAGKIQSISAMPVHKDKCHEELRWEDYQRGDKGGQRPFGQSPGGATFGVPNPQPNLFSQSPMFSQTSASLTSTNPFGPTSTNPNPFGQKTPTPTSTFASPFAQNTNLSVFGPTPSSTTSGFGSTPGFATTTSQPFGSSSTPGFSSSPSIFGSAPTQVSTPAFNSVLNSNNSQSSPLFSSNPSFVQQTSSAFTQQQTTTPFGQQTSSPFGQQASSAINTNSGFAQTSNFNTPSTRFKNIFSSSSSLTTSTSPFSQTTPAGLTPPYQSAQPTQPSGAFSFNNFGQTQTANTTGFTSGMGSLCQGNFGPAPANNAVIQPTPVTNPFGTLPALPQVSIAQGGSSPSIQYGISNMPVVDKPAPARVSSLLTSRHLLQRRVKLPARKYRPNDDGPKVPFFSDEVENSYTPKADAVFIPRENPRALFIRPVEKEIPVISKNGPTPLQENGKSSDGVNNGTNHENEDNVETPPVKTNRKPNGSDIASLLPKLHHAEYFTEPRVQELAAKEKVNPGYCSRVKDFVIGRHGYGNIKFIGETDVRNLDIETLVQFNNREVIVYMDESLKPPVGHGLNKPSEVTLLNIKCMDKKTGKQVKEEGVRLDKYKEMLKRKGEEQGAEFVSYDCVSGEWKFKVEHF